MFLMWLIQLPETVFLLLIQTVMWLVVVVVL